EGVDRHHEQELLGRHVPLFGAAGEVRASPARAAQVLEARAARVAPVESRAAVHHALAARFAPPFGRGRGVGGLGFHGSAPGEVRPRAAEPYRSSSSRSTSRSSSSSKSSSNSSSSRSSSNSSSRSSSSSSSKSSSSSSSSSWALISRVAAQPEG